MHGCERCRGFSRRIKGFVVEQVQCAFPRARHSFYRTAVDDLVATRTFLAAPVEEGWNIRKDAEVIGLPGLLRSLSSILTTR